MTAPSFFRRDSLPRTAVLLVVLANVAVAAEPVSFHRDIRPVFDAHCVGCHQPAKKAGSFDLTDFASLAVGGDSEQPVAVAGQPDESYLLELITPNESGDAQMPREGPPLSEEEIERVRRWIAEGAIDDSPDETSPRYSNDSPPVYESPPTITALDVSPDGSLLAVSGVHEVLLHQLEEIANEPIARLIGISSRIESIRFSPDGKRLAVTGGEPARRGEVQIWDIAERRLLLSHMVTHDTLHGASWSPNGRFVAFGCGDNTVRAIDAETGEQVLFQNAHNDWVLDTVFSVDGSHLISAGRDQTLRLIEVANEQFVDNITSITPGALKGGIQAVARNSLRDEVLVGGADGVPKIYRIHRTSERVIGDDANLMWQLPALPGRLFAVAYNRQGFDSKKQRIAAGSSLDGVGTLQVVEMEAVPTVSTELLELLKKPTHNLSAEEKAKLKKHFADNIQVLAKVTLPTGGIYSVAFAASGTQVVSGGTDGVVRFHKADGGELIAEFVPVPIEQDSKSVVAAGPNDPSFRTDVMPLLAKLGCNGGMCHGAQKGKNGFKLSLRGYDPLADFRALTDDHAGRRTNRAAPEQSLMLLKAVGAVPHEGGQRTKIDSQYYKILRDWIAAGMHDDPEAPRVASLKISPLDPVVEREGDQLQFELTAHYTDGTSRQVTSESFFTSADTAVATVSDAGMTKAIRRGESAILARYEGAYTATTLTVMGDRAGFEWEAAPTRNFIDELVDAKLQHVKTLPGPLCSDEQFVRRIYLDLVGLPPSADQVRKFLGNAFLKNAFLADERTSAGKRNHLIDQLLASEDHFIHRANKWCDLLQVNSKFLGNEGTVAFRQWIHEAMASNMPYDDFARAIVTAVGSNREHPEASYFKISRTPTVLMENTTHLFLGVRFNCNKCHDHPFERWTQDQYYELAGFFARTQLKKDPASGDETVVGNAVEVARPLFEIVADVLEGDVTHPRTGEIAEPGFPFDESFACDPDCSRRQNLAQWLTAPDNPYFARSYVNRVWGYLLGRGLIEPLDDIRAGNPPTNPALLNRLTQEFVASGFDVQQLIRTICQSRTYQLSIETNRWNEDDTLNYSHAMVRRLPAEVLYDTIHTVVGAPWKLPNVAAGFRAAQLPDVQIKLPGLFLDQLGRPARESVCECERSSGLTLGSIMALVNGPDVAKAIADPANELAQLEASISDDAALVEEIFLRVLGRSPTEEEREISFEMLRQQGNDLEVLTQQMRQLRSQSDATLDDWIDQQQIVDWETPRPTEATTTTKAQLEVLSDLSIFATGELKEDTYSITVETNLPRIRAVKIEALTDERLPKSGPGRAADGNFVLSHIRVKAVSLANPSLADPSLADPSATKDIGLRNASADFSENEFPVNNALDENLGNGWGIAGGTGVRRVATFELRGKVGYPEGTRLVVELDQKFPGGDRLLGRFRLSLTGSKPPITWQESKLPVDIRAMIRRPAAQRTPRQRTALREYHRSIDQDLAAIENAITLVSNPRLVGLQDLVWALINTPAFLFNR